MDDVDFGPVGRGGPAKELTTAVTADRHHKSSAGDLFREFQGQWPVKFLGAVAGEGVGGAAKFPHQHRDGGAVGAEVGVEVLSLFEPGKEDAGFGEVDEMVEPAAF